MIKELREINEYERRIENSLTKEDEDLYLEWITEQMENIAQKTKAIKNEPSHNKKRKVQKNNTNNEKTEKTLGVYQELESKLEKIRASIEG